MEPATAVDPNLPVSHEVDGRILTGVGTTAEALAETMDRHSDAPDAADDSPVPAAPSTPSTPAPPRDDAGKFTKPSRGQRRFDELTREREDARREAADIKTRAESAERERDELKARLAVPREPERAPTPAAAPPTVQTRQKPSEDQIGTTYQSYGDFVEDLADWKAEQRLAALDFDARIRQSIEADRASRAFHDSVTQTFTKARELYADFDAVLASGPGSQVEFGPRRDFIASRPNAPSLIYAIAKDGEFAQRLARMSDVEFGMALAAVAAPQVAAPPASAPAQGSPIVPAPYQPVGSGSKTTAIPASEMPKKAGFDYDKSGYREARARERGQRR